MRAWSVPGAILTQCHAELEKPPENGPLLRSIAEHRSDILILAVLAAAASLGSFEGARRMSPAVVEPLFPDLYFAADVPRVFSNMTDRFSNHYRSKVHPLFSLTTFPVVSALRTITGLDSCTAVRAVMACTAGAWLGLFFLLLRLAGCSQMEAVLFSVLAATSAFAVFWFTVPEIHPLGSLTILMALAALTLAHHRKLSPAWYLLASIVTLSMTVTNWMAGILVTLVRYPLRKCLKINTCALLAVCLLMAVQKLLIPTAHLLPLSKEDARYVLEKEGGGPIRVLASFVCHTMVMPTHEVADHPTVPGATCLRVQHSPVGSGSCFGPPAVVLWMILLGLGLWGFLRDSNRVALRTVVLMTLLGQLCLHMVYGSETFLYSCVFGPLLVILAAHGTLTPARPVVRAVVAGLLVCNILNNAAQFQHVANNIDSLTFQ